MSTKSKAWNWDIATVKERWKVPSNNSYWLINRWQSQGKKDMLDLGVGLGRHAIQFAKIGFNVSGFDLSETSIKKTQEWAAQEGLNIDLRVGDMLELPYADESFDCVLAYHSIAHTDTEGIRRVASEIHRVLRENGEFYLSLGSKKGWGFQQDWPNIDENTKKRMEEGPEYGIPHFYADIDLIFDIFKDFELISVEDKQEFVRRDEYTNKNKYGMVESGWHYYVLGVKK